MQIFVKLDSAGIDTGPFMIYSNTDEYVTAYGVNISKTSLATGVTINVPNFTTSVKIRSNGKCTNSIIVNVSATTTTTLPPCYCYILQASGTIDAGTYSYVTCSGSTMTDQLIDKNETIKICARQGSVVVSQAQDISIQTDNSLCTSNNDCNS